MKKFLLPVYALLLLTACQKEVPDIVRGSAVTGNFRAKINGNQWIANASASASINSGVINISGVGNHKLVNITLLGAATGTYSLNDTSLNMAVYIDSSSSTIPYTTQGPAIIAGGQVIVTSIDNNAKTISGTFSFKTFRAADSSKAEFTEGIFQNLKFTSPNLPPATADTLTVKIDSTNFTATNISAVSTGGILTVAGIGAGSKIVSLQMPVSITPGSYPIPGATFNALYTVGTSQIFIATTGTLTILENNTTSKRLRGNFSFSGTDNLSSSTANLTQGYFSVTYN
jgi:hypothetical protein